MLTVEQIASYENGELDELQEAIVMQTAINDGLWGLHGSYGRSMMDAIRSGLCMLGHNRAKDYYGNVVPSRNDVEPGTKGSYQFVLERMGEDWAQQISEVQ